MSELNKSQLEFYQKTGELFFAVAAADKVIRKTEYDSLHNMIVDHWKNLDDFEDEFGVHRSGSWLRYPPDGGHRLTSQSGCMLYIHTGGLAIAEQSKDT